MSKTTQRAKVNLNDNPLAAFTRSVTPTVDVPTDDLPAADDSSRGTEQKPAPRGRSATSAALGQREFLMRMPSDMHALLRLAGFEQNEAMKDIAIRGVSAELRRMGYRLDG
jgi:hypothetical protein